MKRLSIALALLFSVTSAQAIVIIGGSLNKPKTNVSNLYFFVAPTVTKIVAPEPAPVQNTQSTTPIPEQHFVFFTEESKTFLDESVNSVDVPKSEGGSNVSAVPVPAALPLMATALGVFGITRRRKTFK